MPYYVQHMHDLSSACVSSQRGGRRLMEPNHIQMHVLYVSVMTSTIYVACSIKFLFKQKKGGHALFYATWQVYVCWTKVRSKTYPDGQRAMAVMGQPGGPCCVAVSLQSGKWSRDGSAQALIDAARLSSQPAAKVPSSFWNHAFMVTLSDCICYQMLWL